MFSFEEFSDRELDVYRFYLTYRQYKLAFDIERVEHRLLQVRRDIFALQPFITKDLALLKYYSDQLQKRLKAARFVRGCMQNILSRVVATVSELLRRGKSPSGYLGGKVEEDFMWSSFICSLHCLQSLGKNFLRERSLLLPGVRAVCHSIAHLRENLQTLSKEDLFRSPIHRSRRSTILDVIRKNKVREMAAHRCSLRIHLLGGSKTLEISCSNARQAFKALHLCQHVLAVDQCIHFNHKMLMAGELECDASSFMYWQTIVLEIADSRRRGSPPEHLLNTLEEEQLRPVCDTLTDFQYLLKIFCGDSLSRMMWLDCLRNLNCNHLGNIIFKSGSLKVDIDDMPCRGVECNRFILSRVGARNSLQQYLM